MGLLPQILRVRVISAIVGGTFFFLVFPCEGGRSTSLHAASQDTHDKEGASGGPAADDPEWKIVEDFDGVLPSWQIHSSDNLIRTVAQKRTDRVLHHGLRSESVAIFAGKGGERIFASLTLPPPLTRPRAIRELEIGLWVRGDQPGFQLFARVRLPRTIDPATQEGVVTLIPGDIYRRASEWQHLKVGRIDEQVAENTRVLREKLGSHVDPAEAYVDRIVLNLYGSAGLNQIWIDDLSLSGGVESGKSLQGNVSLVHYEVPLHLSTPQFPRFVRHHGESLHFLKSLGMEGIRLPRPANQRELQEASELGLWIVCPPGPAVPTGFPVLAHLDPSPPDPSPPVRVSLDRVLSDPARLSLDQRKSDGAAGPTRSIWLTHPGGERHSIPWTQVELRNSEHVPWMGIRQRVYEAIFAGSSGIVWNTTQSIEIPASRQIRNMIELLNLELGQVEPWLQDRNTTGGDQATVLSDTGKEIGRCCILKNPFSSLALVLLDQPITWSGMVPLALAERTIQLPIQPSRELFLMGPQGLVPLRPRAIAGGTEVSIPGTISLVRLLSTDHATPIRQVTRRLQLDFDRYQSLLEEVAREEIHAVDLLIERLPSGPWQSELRTRLHAIRTPVTNRPRSTDERQHSLELLLWELHQIRVRLDGFPAQPASSPGVQNVPIAEREGASRLSTQISAELDR